MMKKPWATAAVCMAVLTAALSPTFCAPQDEGGVQIGEKVSYSFRNPLVNGMGVSSLADLQGKPVLVEFWGHR